MKLTPVPTDDLIEFMGMQESQYIEPYSTYSDRILEKIRNPTKKHGETLPWPKTYDKYRIRKGELTLWAAVNGHGKSMVLGQVILCLPISARPIIASLEMRPEETITRQCCQAYGVHEDKLTEDQYKEFENRTGHIRIYDQLDVVASDRIIAMVRYAAVTLGIDHFVIDSLVMCGLGAGKDVYEKQTKFVTSLKWIAKNHNIHIHLVHHMRKGHSEYDMPDKFDVKGAGEIADLVDNIIIVHRCMKKEDELAELYAKNNMSLKDRDRIEELKDGPDVVLNVAKARHGDWEGKIGLFYDVQSKQYMEREGAPINLLPPLPEDIYL